MKPPQVSLNSVMAAVALVAIDCMTLRMVELDPNPLTLAITLLVLGCLPMANVLAVGLAILIRRGRANAPFWLGFAIAGGIVFVVNVVLTIAIPDRLNKLLELTEPIVKFVGRRTGLESSPLWELILIAGYVPALWLMPQVLIAFAGGWLSRRLRHRAETLSEDDRVVRRLSWGSLLAMSLLVAIPAMAVEGIRRWVIFPQVVRLDQDSQAVVDLKIMPRMQVTLLTGTPVMLLDGMKVRVEDDSNPSVIEGMVAEGGTLTGDFREVRITLLEGKGAGQSTRLGRCLLRVRR
jgi:hypothetical protein